MSSTGTTRPPAVAGFFYPGDRDELLQKIHWCFTHPLGPGRLPTREEARTKVDEEGRVQCLIVPHAGYDYSGPVAAHSYLHANDFLTKNESAVILVLGPNHYGIGSGVALSPAEAWDTPLGRVEINTKITRQLARDSDIIDIDEVAHSREHSIEVQLPFLQSVSAADRPLSFVPVSLMLQDNESAKRIADSVLKVISESKEKAFLVIASSDLTHYETQKVANSNDSKLLGTISRLDVLEFYSVLERYNVSACGYGAIAVAMYIAKRVGKKVGNLLKYATSGDVTGDKSSVVGYSSVHFA